MMDALLYYGELVGSLLVAGLIVLVAFIGTRNIKR